MAVMEGALGRVQRTSAEVVEAATAAGDVTLPPAAAAAATLPPAETVAAAATFLRLPIRFESVAAEVNALALIHLLDFGSGFDALLLAKTGKDAREAVLFGLLGMLMGGAPVEKAAWLREFSAYSIFQYFHVDASVDESVPGLPGVVLTRQGPLGAFTTALKDALNEAGQALQASGHDSLGALVLALLDAEAAAGQPPSAAALVEGLVEAVPGFRDTSEYHGKQACFYRRAQRLAAELHLRFRGADERFRFGDMAQLAVDSGNVLPAVFRRMGVLQLSETLAAAVDAGTDLQGDEREVALRAATVEAGARLCAAASERSSGAVEPWQLSAYLLRQEEQAQRARQEGGGGAAEAEAGPRRHVARGTTAY